MDLASEQSFSNNNKGLTLSKQVAFLSPLLMPPETLEGFSLLCLNKALFISTLLMDTSVHIVEVRLSSVQKMLIESFGPALPQKRKGGTKAGAGEKSCVHFHSIQNHHDQKTQACSDLISVLLFYLYMQLITSVSTTNCSAARTHWAGTVAGHQGCRKSWTSEQPGSPRREPDTALFVLWLAMKPCNSQHCVELQPFCDSCRGIMVGPSPLLGFQPERLAGWFLHWETIQVQSGRCCCIAAWLETVRET